MDVLPEPMEEEVPLKRKRGRPKGSKNKQPSKKRKETKEKPKKKKKKLTEKPKNEHRKPDEIPYAFSGLKYAKGIFFAYNDEEIGSRAHKFDCWNNTKLQFFYSFISNSTYDEETKTRSYDREKFLRYSNKRDFFYIGYYPVDVFGVDTYLVENPKTIIDFHDHFPTFDFPLHNDTSPPLSLVYHGLADTSQFYAILNEDETYSARMATWFWEYIEPVEDYKRAPKELMQLVPGFPCTIPLDAFGNFDNSINVVLDGGKRIISFRANFSLEAFSMYNPFTEDGIIEEIKMVHLNDFYDQEDMEKIKLILTDQAFLLANFAASLQDPDSRYQGRSYLPGAIIGLDFHFYLPAHIGGVDTKDRHYNRDKKRYFSIPMIDNDTSTTFQDFFDEYSKLDNGIEWYEKFKDLFIKLFKKQLNWWEGHDEESYEWVDDNQDHIYWIPFDEITWTVNILVDEDKDKSFAKSHYTGDNMDWDVVHYYLQDQLLKEFATDFELLPEEEIEKYKNSWMDDEGNIHFD
jgi:hypothetical protein